MALDSTILAMTANPMAASLENQSRILQNQSAAQTNAVRPQLLQQQIEQGQLANQGSDLDLKAKQLEQNLAQHNYASQLLQSLAPDGSNYSDLIQKGQSLGLDFSKAPPEWGAEAQQFVQSAKQSIYDPKTQIALAQMQREYANTQSLIQHRKTLENLATQKFGASQGQPIAFDEEGNAIYGPSQSPNFGFDQSNIPPQVFSKMAGEDSKRRLASTQNYPIAQNILKTLDELEPQLDKFHTGGVAPETRAYIGRNLGTDAGVAAANIEKATNSLATDVSKFQSIPGQKGSVLQLQTILASKPGIKQPEQTNRNIISDMRGKVTDYALSSELQQMYREAAPKKIADENVDKLDSTLKDLFPISSTAKNGQTSFNQNNVDNIRAVMQDAIANPRKYQALQQLKKRGVDITQALQQITNPVGGQ